ncbi:MAG: RNA-dependent DNA polymerase [Planctomycetes bacterium]|nr:RNA-dependent DNA polymerase [Planctomycetota bacterium]
MGKKYKHLYENICRFENLWLASRKARRGKRRKLSVSEFEFDLENKLLEIQDALIKETYQFGAYTRFTIHEPQERQISAAPYRDRVVHHALCNIIEPLLNKAMIYDTYACRIGKGSHRAIQRAQQFLRNYSWVLKLDIRKFFFTIDHYILKKELQKKISDPAVMNLIGKILDTYNSPREYYFFHGNKEEADITRPIGLPIGNLTSQLFANYYLNPMDRFIKEELKIEGYVRYMDDALLFASDKQTLSDAKKDIRIFLEAYRLSLHEMKSQVFPARHGVRFLGFHLYPDKRKILRSNLKRFKMRLKAKRRLYRQQDISWENILQSLNAWLGFADKQRNVRFINEILSHIPFSHTDTGKSFTFRIPSIYNGNTCKGMGAVK